VPSYFSEEAFQGEVESQAGPLQAFFQYKHKNPTSTAVNNKFMGTNKYMVFSAIFRSKDDARMLTKAGFMTLSDGLVVSVEPFDASIFKKRVIGMKSMILEHRDCQNQEAPYMHEKKGEVIETNKISRATFAQFSTISKHHLFRLTSKAYHKSLSKHFQVLKHRNFDIHLSQQAIRFNLPLNGAERPIAQ
jgi:hypothetical protein